MTCAKTCWKNHRYKGGFDYCKLRIRVVELRMSRGWTIEELSRRSGLSRLSIHYVETSKHKASLGTLHRLAQGFNITLSEFLDGL